MSLIQLKESQLVVPDNPTIPFIEGDGIGVDIWNASQFLFDEAIKKVYGSSKKVQWKELLAGKKALDQVGSLLPNETLEVLKSHLIAIKGPLETPVGKGFRSLNVTLRQELDLYSCVRPVRHYGGVPSPMLKPQEVDICVFRENTEDIYMGIEFESNTSEAKKMIEFLQKEMKISKIKKVDGTSIGIKPVTEEGSKRLIRSAIEYAIEKKKNCVSIVHKGNIMKFTEGAFLRYGLELAENEFDAKVAPNNPKQRIIKAPHGNIVINDVIADNFLQQIILNPAKFDVVATMNLNGDYISDALAALVGGIGIAPGGNINYHTGYAIFEATHGTAPNIAGKNMANPSSLILSGKMMFDYLGWFEVGSLIDRALEDTISSQKVTIDFANILGNVEPVSTSEFVEEIIRRF